MFCARSDAIARAKELEAVPERFAQERSSLAGAVAGDDAGDARLKDAGGESLDLFAGRAVEVKSADEGVYFLSGEGARRLRQDDVRARVGAAAEDDEAARVLDDEALLVQEAVGPQPAALEAEQLVAY